MKSLKVIILSLPVICFAFAGAQADGWKRDRVTTGPHGGQWKFSGNGNCSGGNCSSNQKWTGPNGGTVTRHGSTQCSNGTCEGTATWKGTHGKTWSTQRRFKRY